MNVYSPAHPSFVWAGCVEVRHTERWSQAWRLPLSLADRVPDGLFRRAGMAAGVRITFRTDSDVVTGSVAEPDTGLSPLDLVVDGHRVNSVRVNSRGAFAFTGLGIGTKNVELWLPQFGALRLRELVLAQGAVLLPPKQAPPGAGARQLIAYGSSITQCRQAASPTRTWPALVSRSGGYELTSLGFAGECHLDPQVAAVIRDLPAALIIMCVGINIYDSGTFNQRSFAPALDGFITTVRTAHPTTPLLVMSPIYSPAREDVVRGAGMTLADMRTEVHRTVRVLRDQGDRHLHYVDGLDVLGDDHADLLPDGVHPNAAGYEKMAVAITTQINSVRS